MRGSSDFPTPSKRFRLFQFPQLGRVGRQVDEFNVQGKFKPLELYAALLVIPLVLLGRSVSVGVPINLLRLRRDFLPYTVRMMVWGGLRGGISVALALSLPPGRERDLIVTMTYFVVVFAILVQGLTVGQVAKRIPKPLEP